MESESGSPLLPPRICDPAVTIPCRYRSKEEREGSWYRHTSPVDRLRIRPKIQVFVSRPRSTRVQTKELKTDADVLGSPGSLRRWHKRRTR